MPPKREIKKEKKEKKEKAEDNDVKDTKRQLSLSDMKKSSIKKELRIKQEQKFKQDRDNIKAELAKQVSLTFPSPPVISRNVQMAYEAMVRQQTLSMFGSDSADSAEEEPASKRAKNEEYKHEDDVDSFLPAKTSTATDVDIQLELFRRAEAQSRAAVGLTPSSAGSLYKDVQEAFDKMSR